MATLFYDGQVLGGDGSHLCHLLRLTSPGMRSTRKTSSTPRKTKRTEDSRFSPMKSNLFAIRRIPCGRKHLAHELGKARCGHGTFRSRAPWISIALSMSIFHKLAVPKRDLNATLSLLTRSRRFIIFRITRGSYSQ